MAVDPRFVADICSNYIAFHSAYRGRKISLLYFDYFENNIYDDSRPYTYYFVEHLSSYNDIYFYIKVPPSPDTDGQKYVFFTDLRPDGNFKKFEYNYSPSDVIVLPPGSSTVSQSIPSIFNDYLVSDSRIKDYVEIPFDILVNKIVVIAGPMDGNVLAVKVNGVNNIDRMVSCEKGLVCSKLYFWIMVKEAISSERAGYKLHVNVEVKAK